MPRMIFLFLLLLLTASGTRAQEYGDTLRQQLERDLAELEKRVPALKDLNARIAAQPEGNAGLYLQRARMRIRYTYDHNAKKRAFDDFERALALDPDLADAHWELAVERLYDLVNHEIRNGDRPRKTKLFRDIDQGFDEALRLKPDYRNHRYLPFYRGVLRYATGEYVEALAYLNRALEISDEKNFNAVSHRNRTLQFRSLVHLAAGRWEESIADFKAAARANAPGIKPDEYLEGIIAVAFDAVGETDEALRRLDFHLAKRYHDLGIFSRWRALLLLKSKRFDEGVDELLRSPSRNWMHFQNDISIPHSVVHFVPREIWNEAIAVFDEEIERRPDDMNLRAQRDICWYFHAYHALTIHGEAIEDGGEGFAAMAPHGSENASIDYLEEFLMTNPGRGENLIDALEGFLKRHPGFRRATHLLLDEQYNVAMRLNRETYFQTIFKPDPAVPWKEYFDERSPGEKKLLSDSERKKRKANFEKSYRTHQEAIRMDFFRARVRLLASDPDDIRLRHRVLNDFLYHIQEEQRKDYWPQALELARIGMDRHPDFLDFYDIYAQCYTKIHFPPNADPPAEHWEHLRDIYTRWIESHPEDDRGYLKRVERQRESKAVMADRRAALERNPLDVRNLMSLAHGSGWYGDWFIMENVDEPPARHALEYFDRAIEILETADSLADIEPYLRQKTLPEAWLHRGRCYGALKEYENALADFTAVIEHPETPDIIHDALMERAKVLFRLGRGEESRADVAAFLERKPKEGARVLRFYEQSRQWERQIEYLEEESRTNPSKRQQNDKRIETLRKERGR